MEAELRRRFGGSEPTRPPPVISLEPDTAFDDADKLKVGPMSDMDNHHLDATTNTMLRSDLGGVTTGSFKQTFDAATPEDKKDLLLSMSATMENKEFRTWVEKDPARLKKWEDLVRDVRPPDPSIEHNREVNARVDSFKEWGPPKYKYDAIIVPGFTPLDEKIAKPGVNDVGAERLAMAKKAFDQGDAPFIILSGGAVYPRGTQYSEAVEMKKKLIEMGVPSDRIIVDAQARHTTTNLRNSGRYMLDHNMKTAKVVTGGGPGGPFDQDFYLRNPNISTFNMRCRKELGYKPGSLNDSNRAGDIVFKPSEDVRRFHHRDPLDT